ncbi:MAG: geranylgeranyl reductase family protein [Mycobacteriales bacterium]
MTSRATQDADVVVVGAGPAGSTVATYLAQAGVDVLLLEKSSFPREKVCGDGLTPRGVKQLVALGVDTSVDAGWVRNDGLRIIGGGVRLELPWPALASYPDYGLVRPRLDFDEMLARIAQKAGARLHEQTEVTEPVLDDGGRLTGVRAKRVPIDAAPAEDAGEPVTFRAPLVLAADGASSRLALSMGRRKRDDRPMGVAVRRYYLSPRHLDNYLESWLELWQGDRLLPGYGWIFGLGDGTSNVGVGLLNTSAGFRNTNYKALLDRWLATMPAAWGYVEENATGPMRGGALPMGFNRVPHYSDGLLLVGDAGGAINPFNGEGIAYAMEGAQLAAELVVQALPRDTAGRDRVLARYPAELKARYGGYFTLGRMFVHAIGSPKVMALATRHGLPRPTLMKFTLKLLANLTDPRDGDALDRLISAMTRLAPAA